MQQRVQKPKETISFYYYEKLSLYKELEFDFAEIKEQIAIGLWSKELSTFILSRSHADEDELFQDIVKYERIDNTRRERIMDGRDKRIKQERKEAPGQYRNQTNEIVKEEITQNKGRDNRPPLKNDKGEPKCYNCEAYGHISKCCKESKKEVKCYRFIATTLDIPLDIVTNIQNGTSRSKDAEYRIKYEYVCKVYKECATKRSQIHSYD